MSEKINAADLEEQLASLGDSEPLTYERLLALGVAVERLTFDLRYGVDDDPDPDDVAYEQARAQRLAEFHEHPEQVVLPVLMEVCAALSHLIAFEPALSITRSAAAALVAATGGSATYDSGTWPHNFLMRSDEIQALLNK